MILWIKIILWKIVKTIFLIIPIALVKRITSIVPRLFVCAPPGIVYEISDYLGQFRVRLDTKYNIERKMFTGHYERDTFQIIEEFVNEGDICFDIGANVGPVMFALAQKIKSSGKIYAFEPGPPIFKRLAYNVALNPHYNEVIIIENLGVGEKNTELYWTEELRYEGRGNGSMRVASSYRDINVTISSPIAVDVVSLDSYCQNKGIENVDFIKIDVEGMEYEVLKGAKNILEKYQPIIYFETLPNMEESLGFPVFTEIQNMLKCFNYKFYSVNSNGDIKNVDKVGVSLNSLASPKDLSI